MSHVSTGLAELLEAFPQRSAPGLTVAEVARRYRVSPDKIRAWIAKGELAAVNTATVLCGRPRWVIPQDALAVFERRRLGERQAKPVRPGKRRPTVIDYYPDP